MNRKYLESVLEAELDLLADEGVALAQDVPPLRVAQDDPLAAHVLDHGRADLAREGPLGSLVAVLKGQGFNRQIVVCILGDITNLTGFSRNTYCA